jgi:hypothetical protein
VLTICAAVIPDTRLANRHRPDAGLDRPFRHMPVTNQTPVALICRQMSVGRKGFRDLGFDCLRQQATRSVAQDLGQRTGDLAGGRKVMAGSHRH